VKSVIATPAAIHVIVSGKIAGLQAINPEQSTINPAPTGTEPAARGINATSSGA
jgi:hypothetical protein